MSRSLPRALISALALAAGIAGLAPAAPALAGSGGPPAPGWHWYDDNGSPDPDHGYQDLSSTGRALQFAGGTDSGSVSLTTPFPVTVNGVTTSAPVVSADGYTTFGSGATVAAYAYDLVTSELFVQTLGTAPNRQFVVSAPTARRYGGSYAVPYSMTFFEGRHGVLVSYGDLGPVPGAPSATEGKRGLADTAWTSASGALTVPWTGDFVDHVEVLYTDGSSAEVPDLVVPATDTYGYHLKRVGEGAPSGSYDLDTTGKVLPVGTDSGVATVDLPFAFSFYGTSYSQIRVHADTGFSFGGSTSPPGMNSLVNAYDWYGQWPDSGLVHNTDWQATMQVAVRGTAPNRQFVVQWSGNRYGNGAPAALGKVQLVLFEGSEDLAFLYPNAIDLAITPSNDLGVASVNPMISHNGEVRHRDTVRPTDGAAILWTTDPDGSRTLATAPAGSSSSDGYGYRAIRSDNGGAIAYDWIDTAGGTTYLTGSDSGSQLLTTPFPVRLYGTEATQLLAHADGHLYLGASGSGGRASSFPDASRPLLVQPYGADLVTTPGLVTRTVGTAPHRRFAVTWDGFRYGNASLKVRYQVVFREDSTDVLTQYAEIEDIVDAGNTAVVGINRDGETRLQVSANAQDLSDESAILYTTSDLVSVDAPTTIRPDGHPVTLTTSVVNTGLSSAASVRQELTLDGPAADPDAISVEAYDGAAWVGVPLTGSAGSLSGIVPVTDGDAFTPGTSLTVPLRITAGEDAPLGALNIGTVLRTLSGGNPVGVYAASSDATQVAATVPDAPEVTTTPGNGQVEVSWTPASNGGQAITGYTVTRNPGNVVQNVGPEVSSAVFAGLTNGTAYTFSVVAANTVGDSEAGSASGTPFTVASAPTAVGATAGNGSVDVSWTAPAANGSPITGYKVTRTPGNVVTTVAAGQTSTTISGLANGTEYTFTVVASNAAGDSAASAPASATPVGAPTAPGGVQVTAGDGSLGVTWDAAAANGSLVTGYTVTAQPGNHTATVGGSTLAASLPGLANATSYTVTVVAANVAGESAPSAAASGTPYGVPAAPGNVVATSGSKKLVVTWNAAAPNGRPVTGYTVTAQPGNHTATVGGSALTADVTGLANGTSYTVTVTATNLRGTSAASADSTGTPGLAPVTALTAEGLAVGPTVYGPAAIEVGWQAPADAVEAKVCVVAASDPAPGNCTGTSVPVADGTAVVPVPAGSGPVTVTVFPSDADSQGPGASTTLARSSATVSKTSLVVASTARPMLTLTLTGVPAGTRTAHLLYRPLSSTGAWTSVATVSGTGSLSAALPVLTSSVKAVWRYDGAANVIGSSTETTVTVKPKLTIKKTPSAAKVGRTVTLWGTMTPNRTDSKVTLFRKSGSRWVAVGKPILVKKYRMPDGRTIVGYRFVVKMTAKGTQVFQVRSAAGGTGRYAASTSPSISVKVT